MARLIPITGLRPESGRCWIAELPAGLVRGDTPAHPEQSCLRLFENGMEVGPAHSDHDAIRALGGGRFSHWGDRIYLSTLGDGRADQAKFVALIDSEGQTDRGAIFAAAAQVNPSDLGMEQRYAWGERVFNLFVPEVKLPEWGRSMFQDRELLVDYERFDTTNYRSLDRKLVLREFLRVALRQAGDLAECGVFRGASAYLMAKAIARDGGGRELHLFDSFSGLSAPGPVDGGHWRAGDLSCSADMVAANLEPFFENVRLYPGWIPTRFKEVASKQFALVHLDVDLYQPTADALAFFYPRMNPGGVIICDDYGFDTCPGARRAMDEFFNGRSEAVLHLPTGQGLVLIDREGAA